MSREGRLIWSPDLEEPLQPVTDGPVLGVDEVEIRPLSRLIHVNYLRLGVVRPALPQRPGALSTLNDGYSFLRSHRRARQRRSRRRSASQLLAAWAATPRT